MRRPILPLGSLAPWVLAGCAALLAVAGLLAANREMVILAGVAALAFVVAFPLARLVIGKHQDGDGE
jgi:hypothetical protein